MSTLSIVVLSVLAAIFSLILIASIGVLIWLLLRQHRALAQFLSALETHSGKLSLLESKIGGTLEIHRAKVDEQISKIRGEEISTAVKDFLVIVPKQAQVATRIERAVLLFTDLVKHLAGEYEISESDIQRAKASGLGPESYATAAPGEHYISRSRVTADDASALADEAADHTQSFDEGFQP
jgi:hypothetical protein